MYVYVTKSARNETWPKGSSRFYERKKRQTRSRREVILGKFLEVVDWKMKLLSSRTAQRNDDVSCLDFLEEDAVVS